jgi:hypothetical protein
MTVDELKKKIADDQRCLAAKVAKAAAAEKAAIAPVVAATAPPAAPVATAARQSGGFVQMPNGTWVKRP